MANWLHKTTLEYRTSSDPPVGEQADWLRNPTMPAGVASWSDVIVESGTVRAPSSTELAAQNAAKLAAAKAAKIEAIDAKTAAIIEAGSVTVNGVAINTELTSQVSLNNLDRLVAKGIAAWPQDYSASNGGKYTIVNQADMDRIAGIVATFVMTTKAAGRALRLQVLACSTVAEVNAITDSRS